MPKHIKLNVEGHRFLDTTTNDKNKEELVVCEDVTSVVLPTLEHPTTSIENVSGMAMDMDMPNTTRYKAAEYSVAHNNGKNCHLLARPGMHKQEFRVARQDFKNKGAEVSFEGVKYRMHGFFASVEKGTVETGNPLGSTAKYKLKRYEEIVDGTQTMLVDATTGELTVNGVSYTQDLESLLK